MNIGTMKKKVEQALKKLEAMKAMNNYFIFWEKEPQPQDIPQKSLVVQLTEYKEGERRGQRDNSTDS